MTMTLERANQLRDLGRWVDAEPLYADLLGREPGNADARFGHALNLMAGGDWDGAIAELTEVLRGTPGRADARYHRAVSCAQLGRDDEALADLDRLLADGSGDWYIWSDRGALLGRVGRLAEGISNLRTAVQIQPAGLAAHFNLGCLLDGAGELDEAYAELTLAAQGGFPGATGMRDQVRRRLALRIDEADLVTTLTNLRRDPAAAAVTELASRFPYLLDRGFQQQLAAAARSNPNPESGGDQQWAEVLRRLSAPEPNTANLAGERGERAKPGTDPADIARYVRLSERLALLHRRGYAHETAALARELTALASRLFGDESIQHGKQLMTLALTEARDRLWEAAFGHLQDAVGILTHADPAALPDGMASYAAALSNAGMEKDAASFYQLALLMMLRVPGEVGHETAARVYAGLGESLIRLGSAEQAEAILREGVNDPRLPAVGAGDSLATVLTTLGEAVFHQGRPAEAIELCQQAVELRRDSHGELHPAVATAMRNLGRVYSLAGNLGAAHLWLSRSAGIWRQLAGDAADPAEEGLTYGDLAQLCATVGSPDEARTAAAGALAAVGRLADTLDRQVPYILGQVRNAFEKLGDLDAELAAQEQLIAETRRRPPGTPTSEQLNTLANIHFRRKEYDKAQIYYTQALEMTIAAEPENHEVIAVLQHNLANILADAGQNSAAQEMHEKALAGFRKVWPPDDPRLLSMILEVAELYFDTGQPARAAGLLDEARPFLAGQAGLEARGAELARQLGQDSADGAGLTPATAQIGLLARQAHEMIDSGDLERAELLFNEAMELAVTHFGPRDPETATSKFNLAVTRRRRGLTAGVTELLREVVDIREEKLDPGDQRIVRARLELADVLQSRGQDTEATQLAAQVVQSAPSGMAANDLGRAHNILGLVLHRGRVLAESEQHLREAMRIADEADDPGNRITARQNLALLLLDAGKLADATVLTDDAYQLSVRHFGPDDPVTAKVMLTQVKGLCAQGRYAEAEPLARQALAGVERAYPSGHPAVADALNEVGLTITGQGAPERAEPFFERAIAAAAGGELAGDSTVMLNQAQVFADLGYPDRAVLLARSAVERIAGRAGTSGVEYGHALGVLGGFEAQAGQRFAAVQDLTQAVRILEPAVGTEGRELVAPLSDLARIYLTIGARDAARSFAQRAVSIARTAYGPAHPVLSPLLATLGHCLAVLGDTAEAIRLSQAAVELSPTMPGTMRWLGRLQAATGNRAQALATMDHVIAFEDARLPGVLDLASEEHRNAYAAALWQTVSEYLSLAGDDAAAAGSSVTRRAWELVIHRRGLNGEYLRFEREAALRGDRPELARYLRELADVRADLARAVTRSDTSEADRLRQRRSELERLLAGRLPVDSRGTWLGSIDAEKVVAALPAETTLIEFVRIAATDFANLALGTRAAVRQDDPLHTKPQQRYLAFVAGAGVSAAVRLVDLGPAEPIEQEIAALRAQLVSPVLGARSAGKASDRGDALRQLLIDPLRDFLRPGHRLLIVADGDIGQIPLQILPAGGGRRLIDDHLISYVSSSREIVRWSGRASRQPASPALILADPDYDRGGPADATSPGGLPRLPATLLEAQEIGRLLATEPLTGAAAAKIALEEARSPLVVHLATHGIFLPTQVPRGPRTAYMVQVPGEGTFLVQADRGGHPDDGDSDPLLRSALALAGYNAWLNGSATSSEAGNGVLTADEVCSLHLRGTRLVALSACDTGLGDQRQAEGLIGLRWAFGVAGAKTIVSSLWKVADRPTQELMAEFYQQLLGGATVPEALRAAQLVLRGRHSEPFWWGAFICHGDPGTTLR